LFRLIPIGGFALRAYLYTGFPRIPFMSAPLALQDN
jgi:hypothetical protein